MFEQTLLNKLIKLSLLFMLYVSVCTFIFVSTVFVVVKISADFGIPFDATFFTAIFSIFTYSIFMPLLAFISEFAKSSLVVLAEINLLLSHFVCKPSTQPGGLNKLPRPHQPGSHQ